MLKDYTDKKDYVISEVYYETVMISYGACFSQYQRQKIINEVLAEKMRFLNYSHDFNKYYNIDHAIHIQDEELIKQGSVD